MRIVQSRQRNRRNTKWKISNRNRNDKVDQQDNGAAQQELKTAIQPTHLPTDSTLGRTAVAGGAVHELPLKADWADRAIAATVVDVTEGK
jgi:hypothetical protein